MITSVLGQGLGCSPVPAHDTPEPFMEPPKIMTIETIRGCIGCGTCMLTCPTDVIRQDTRTRKARIQYPADCQICHLCRLYCPVDAITISPEKSIPVVVSWG